MNFKKFAQLLVRSIPVGEYYYNLRCWLGQVKYVRDMLAIKIIGNTTDGEFVLSNLSDRIDSVLSCLLIATRIPLGFKKDKSRSFDSCQFMFQKKWYSLTLPDLKQLKSSKFLDVTSCTTHLDISLLLDIGTKLKAITHIRVKEQINDEFEIVQIPVLIKQYFNLLAKSYKLFTEFTEVLRDEHLKVLEDLVQLSLSLSFNGNQIPWKESFESMLACIKKLFGENDFIPVLCVSSEVIEYITHKIDLIKEFFASYQAAGDEFGLYTTCVSPINVAAPFYVCNKCRLVIFFDGFSMHLKKCVAERLVECNERESRQLLDLFLSHPDVRNALVSNKRSLVEYEKPLIGVNCDFKRLLVIYCYLEVLTYIHWFFIK